MIPARKLDKEKKLMTNTDKEDVECPFNLKTTIHNTMYTFFYSNIFDFAGDLEGIIDEVTYKTSIQKYSQTWLEGKLLQVL